MFGFGVTEMVLVAFVAILLFPPRELPKIAREIARLYGYARRTADQFRSAILEDEELNKPIREIKNIYHETRYELRRAEELAQREMAKVRMEARMAARTQRKSAPGESAETNETREASADVSDDAPAAHDSNPRLDRASSASNEGGATSRVAPGSSHSAEASDGATAGDADAPPPRRAGSANGRVSAPPPTLRKPAASVPRGTVTPHGAGRASADPQTPDSAGPDRPAMVDDGASSRTGSPSTVDDSAAGAA